MNDKEIIEIITYWHGKSCTPTNFTKIGNLYYVTGIQTLGNTTINTLWIVNPETKDAISYQLSVLENK